MSDEKVERWTITIGNLSGPIIRGSKLGLEPIEVVPASALARVEEMNARLNAREEAQRDAAGRERVRAEKAEAEKEEAAASMHRAHIAEAHAWTERARMRDRAEKAEAERRNETDARVRAAAQNDEMRKKLVEVRAELDEARARQAELERTVKEQGSAYLADRSRIEAVREWAEEVHRTLPSRSQIYAGATRVLSLLDKKEGTG